MKFIRHTIFPPNYVEIFKNSVLVIFDGIYREDFRLHKKSFNEDDENSNSSKD